MNNRLLISCFILILAAHFKVSAQEGYSFLSFEEVSLTTMQVDKIPSLGRVDHYYYPESSYNPESNMIYILDEETFIEIDLNSRQWFQIEKGFIAARYSKIGYSAYHDKLLVWDPGVGRVFQLDSTYTFTRLDNSINHRSQFEHLGWIDPETGSIYALGGYGFFENKSHLLRYNHSSGIWELVDYMDPLQGPSLNYLPTGIYDYVNQNVYVITSVLTVEQRNTMNHRSDINAIWMYSIPSRTWEKKFEFEGWHNFVLKNKISLMLQSKHERLPVIVFPSNHEDLSMEPLCFFHTDHHNLRCLESSRSNVLKNLKMFSLVWSERDQAYYFLGMQSQTASQRNLIRVVKMTITDEQAFMQWVEEEEQPWYLTSAWWMTFGLVSLGLVVFGVYFGRRNKWLSDPAIRSGEYVISIVQTDSGEYALVGSRRTIQGLPDAEHKLLSMLVDSFTTPDLFLKSDDIDGSLSPTHPNQDYIRRLRNVTLERLEALFESAGGKQANFILRRSTLADKRKNEYRLNEMYVKIGE